MTEAFIRKYSLTIGRNNQLIEYILPRFHGEYQERKNIVNINGKVYSTLPTPLLLNDSYKDFVTIPPKSLTITDLQIQAVIHDNKNFDKSSSQDSTIKIFNLSPKNRDFIKSGDSVILKAGYSKDKELPLIYAGQISYVENKRQSNGDIITEIFSTPSVITNNIKISKSYPRNSRLGDILKDLTEIAARKGIPTGEIVQEEPTLGILNRLYPSGYYAKGPLLGAIEEICSANHLRSYVLLGRLYIESKFVPRHREVVVITPQNIKTSLQPEDDKSGKEVVAQRPVGGISSTLFLNGNITTNCLARIKVDPYSGDYNIKSVKHILDLEGNDWDTEIHCEKVTA